MSDLQVLIIDDEKNIRTTLRMCLESIGCRVTDAAGAEAGRAAVERQSFDLVFLDLRLGEHDGLDLLPALLARRPGLDIVVVTAFATIATAVEAIQRGARDYLPKPFTPPQIRQIVDRLNARLALERKVSDLQSRLGEAAPAIDLETESPHMQALLEVLGKAAGHDVPVLLRGENGTGKSVLARQLHAQSERRAHPFVVVNCPTLSAELLASEMFGHAKGAFTGAVRDQPGRVEAAEGGTLLLDEIGELSPSLQAKLLRFLQEKQFERIGENQTRAADVRIVAATNRNLEEEVAAGRFREDLLYRLNTFELVVPPLRDRKEDLVRLARQFLAFFARSSQRAASELMPDAEAALLGYAWPGNIRELRNAMERAAILTSGSRIGVDALPERIVANTRGAPFVGGDFSIEAIEREHILRVLGRHASVEEAADVLGIDTSTLWRKRKRYEQAG